MNRFDDTGIRIAQDAARAGKHSHEVLQLLLNYFQSKGTGNSPVIHIERSLIQAFRIPLRTVRDCELWVGINDRGDLSNEDIDRLLDPWIANYLHQ